MSTEEKLSRERKLFMQSILSLLPFGYWNYKLLEDAEEACKFTKGYHNFLFPDGLSSTVDFLEHWQDMRMLEILSHTKQPTRIRDKIAVALKVRVKECVSKLIHTKNAAYFALPSNITLASKLGFRTCNMIWRYVGDQSTNHNYYTKRSLLFTVYVSSIMYYIQDESENYIETDQFINDSISDIVNIFSKFKLPDLTNIPIIRMFV